MAKAPTKGGEDAADPQKQPENEPAAPVTDAAQAAELVGIGADEVLSFRLYDDRVVVVTIAGQKLEAPL